MVVSIAVQMPRKRVCCTVIKVISDMEKSRGVLSHFLTDTLEFVFAASDVIDVGLGITEIWLKNHTMGHSFYQFRDDYMATLPN